jgi:flagellar biosynthesis/type III secretory pathway protein FliH
MTALIRAASAEHRIRPIAALCIAKPGGEPFEVADSAPAEDPELSALRLENEKLCSALAKADARMEEAAERAREEGRLAGIESVREAERTHAELLGAGVERALSQWQKALSGLEHLAPLIARAALGKLLDRPEERSDLVGQIVARQLKRLGREGVVAVHVSASDFGAEAGLSALRAKLNGAPVELIADPQMASGECRLRLRLGELDAGLPTQWAELSAFLAEAAQGEEG